MLATILLAAACACNRPVSLKVDLCTPENVVKALELSKQFLPEEPCGNCLITYAGATTMLIYEPYREPEPPSNDKRKQAKKLVDEADALDKKQEDAAFIRKILKACKE